MTVEPLLTGLAARKFLASLKGGTIIAQKTLAQLVVREGLPCHLDPFGTGRRVFLESELRTWWAQKLQVSTRLSRGAGRPRVAR